MTIRLTSHVERSAIVLDHVVGTVGDVAALSNYSARRWERIRWRTHFTVSQNIDTVDTVRVGPLCKTCSTSD